MNEKIVKTKTEIFQNLYKMDFIGMKDNDRITVERNGKFWTIKGKYIPEDVIEETTEVEIKVKEVKKDKMINPEELKVEELKPKEEKPKQEKKSKKK